jgi:glutathione S-transferase
MPSYRLFYSPGACSLAPHIALEEIGASYEGVRVTIAEGLNQRPEYLAVNPRGRVPALAIRDGRAVGEERILTEAMAIMVYLARVHPEANLLPTDTEALVRALEWMGWLGSTMHQTGARPVFRSERLVADPAAAPSVAQRGRETFGSGLADIEQRLRGRAFALGERYSLVDAYLLVFFRWGNRMGFRLRENFPEFTRVMDAVRARPAVRRVVEQEQIELE